MWGTEPVQLFVAGERFELHRGHGRPPAGATLVSGAEAAEVLSAWRRDAIGMAAELLDVALGAGGDLDDFLGVRLFRLPSDAGASPVGPALEVSDLHEFLDTEAAAQDAEHFIEIVLFDETDRPLPDQPYELSLPNGKHVSGRTDAFGAIRVDAIFRSGTCTVRFPELEGVAVV